MGPDDLIGHRLYLAEGGKVGFAIDEHGDLLNLFNNGGPRGAGGDAVTDANARGARTRIAVASGPGRPVSESGRLCYGDGAHGRGGRRRMLPMSPSLRGTGR